MKKTLDEILLQVSKSVVIDNGDLLASIRLVLNSVISGLHIKRAGVWFLADESSAIQCILLKDIANDIETDNLKLTELDYPNYFAALRNGRALIADHAQTDPRTDEFTDAYLVPLGIESMLDVPIRHRGVMVGIICCEHIGPARHWTADEATFAAALADLIGRAINAKDYRDTASRLEKANQQLEFRVRQRTKELQSTLASLQTAQKQLIQSEKMAALGGLVSGIAHEVNTPLGVSVTAISHMDRELNKLMLTFEKGELGETEFLHYIEETKEALDIITSNVNRAVQLVRDFKKTAVNQSVDTVNEFLVHETIRALIASLHPATKQLSAIIHFDCPVNLKARTYEGALSQILTNLIMNSLTHAFEQTNSPKITIDINAKNNIIHLIYKDNGCGIPSDFLARIFEPFFTTKRGRGGSGLGLSILYNLVTQKLQGKVDVTSEANAGTEFHISFPQQIESKQAQQVLEPEPGC